MTTITLEDLRRNPELLGALHAQARLERSQYMHTLLHEVLAAIGRRRPRLGVALRTAPCA